MHGATTLLTSPGRRARKSYDAEQNHQTAATYRSHRDGATRTFRLNGGKPPDGGDFRGGAARRDARATTRQTDGQLAPRVAQPRNRQTAARCGAARRDAARRDAAHKGANRKKGRTFSGFQDSPVEPLILPPYATLQADRAEGCPCAVTTRWSEGGTSGFRLQAEPTTGRQVGCYTGVGAQALPTELHLIFWSILGEPGSVFSPARGHG